MINGQFTVPKNIKRAIEQCVATNDQSLIIEEYHRLLEEYKRYRKLMIPAKIDYHGDLTIDAYTTFYLPRNIVIPWIAMRDLSLHSRLRVLPEELNILDLGSGTGAIVLGLLHLFHSRAFSTIKTNVVSVDYFPEALKRQQKLIKSAGFSLTGIHFMKANLNNFDDYVDSINEHGPYDFVFTGNCFTELEEEAAKNIIAQIPGFLSDNGVVIIAEAQRDYIKAMIGVLARLSNSVGLSVFYPCPEYSCDSDGWCWVWRAHDCDFPQMQIAGKPLEEYAREDLVLSWLMLTKKKRSLYHDFRKNNPHLFFGPVAQEKSLDKEKRRYGENYGICTGEDVRTFKKNYQISPNYSRGSIVGLTEEGEIEIYQNLD
jgi:SAM-dependent methyltransferase